MTASAASPTVGAGAREARVGSATFAVARRAFRQVRIGALVCGIAFGATAAASAATYADTFPTLAGRAQLEASTSGDVALSMLVGPASGIGTVGGYTVYKGFVFLTTIGALWALFATTRLLRGEEDAGRWQLLVTGQTDAARIVAATLAALLVAVAVAFMVTAAVVARVGRDPKVSIGLPGALRYSASLALVPAVFVGVGALASQLARTRRGANGLGAVVFALATIVRMVADSSTRLHALRWTTPFGWSELMHPLTQPDLVPLLPALLATAGLAGAASVFAGRRDVGDGVLRRRDRLRYRPTGLGSTFGLALRQDRTVLLAWCTGAAASGLFLGFLSRLTTQSIPDSFQDTLERLGVQGSFTRQYFGVAFLLVATVLALLPASQIGAAAQEELSGRLTHLLVRRPSRVGWLLERLGMAAAAVVVAGLLAGFGAWVGAATQGVPIGFGPLLVAGLNAVPPALVVLGFGSLLFAVVPRFAAAAVYVVVIWSLLVDAIAPLAIGTKWLAAMSVFHWMPRVPAQTVDTWSTVLMLGIAGALVIASCEVFRRRDLAVTAASSSP